MSEDIEDVLSPRGRVILGVPQAHAKLKPWLEKLVGDPDTRSLELTLYQVASGQGEKPVAPVTVDLEPEDRIDRAIAELLKFAIEDMDAHNRRTSFAVRAASHDDRVVFVLDVRTGGRDEQGRSDYFPNMEGVTLQQMDHSQRLHELVVEQSGASSALLMEMVRDLRTENAFLKRREMQTMQNAQILIEAADSRAMRFEEFRREQERKDKLTEGFKAMAPPLLATMLGPQAAAAIGLMMSGAAPQIPGLPGAGPIEPTDENLVDALLIDLERTPGELDMFLAVLSPTRRQLFAKLQERSTYRREAKAKAEADAQKATDTRRNGGKSDSGESGGHSWRSPFERE